MAPNEMRLSCAAVLWFSQLQFYYEGRRQLQPPVRPQPVHSDSSSTARRTARQFASGRVQRFPCLGTDGTARAETPERLEQIG